MRLHLLLLFIRSFSPAHGFFLCVCVLVGTGVGMGRCVWVSLYKCIHELETRGQHEAPSSITLHLYTWIQGLSLNLDLTSWIDGWPASPRAPHVSASPGPGLTEYTTATGSAHGFFF